MQKDHTMPHCPKMTPYKEVASMHSRNILVKKIGGKMSALRDRPRLMNFVNGVVSGASASVEVHRDVWVIYPHHSYVGALTADMRRVREDVKKAKSVVAAEHSRAVAE